MIVAGVHSRQSGGRYDVALAVVDDATVLAHNHVLAAAGEAESDQFRNLYVRAHEVLRPHAVEVVVLWPPDPPPGGRVKLTTTLAAGRAEGAVLAAAGELGMRSAVIAGAGVRAAGGGSTDEAVEGLWSSLADVPDDDAVRRAIAAARTWRIRNA